MADLRMYADAARNARFKQVVNRPRRLVPPGILAAGRPAAGWVSLAAGAGVDPAPQSGPVPDPVEDGVLRAVGRERAATDPGLWTDPGDGLLFLFHLHGFAELARYCTEPPTAAGDRFWQEVLRGWVAVHPRPGGPGWHPFPTSGRVIAWCAALSRGGWPDGLAAEMRVSLGRQLLLLRRSVEHDVGGNHAIRNAAALVIGGACLRDRRAHRRGLAVLRGELGRQILADGGHEERAPSYHRAVRADLVDVATVLGRAGEVPGWLQSAIASTGAWLAALAGPDGRLPLLNDGWEGPPVDPAGDAFRDLADTGYVVLRHGDDQAVLDLAPVSPPHLPPHAHADVGSFVLWAGGRRVVVDPGTCTYEEPRRSAFRATAAHSTLEVDGTDQFRPWGPFRAAFLPRVRRPEPLVVEHDGYRRLPDPVVHHRRFAWVPGGGLVVLDRLQSRGSHDTVSRLPLAPGLQHADAPLRITPLGEGGEPAVAAGRYSPYFGRSEAIEVVTRAARLRPGAVTGWALLRPGYEARLEGERVTVLHDGVEIAGV